MNKIACTLAALLALAGRIGSGCEEIAVLYGEGAAYLLLDGGDLETVAVGDLRWRDVWGVDFVYAGSTSARFAFDTDRLSARLAKPSDSEFFQRHAMGVLENVAERDGTAGRIAISHDYDPAGPEAVRWIVGTDRLAVWSRKASAFTVVDKHLREVRAWTVDDHDAGESFACAAGDGVVVGGHRNRTRFEGTEVVVEPLAFPDGAQDCRMSGPFLDCLGGFECRRGERYVNGVLDPVRNAVVAAFEYRGPYTIPRDPERTRLFAEFENRLLFAGGTRLLQQEKLWTPVHPDIPHSYGSRPTSRLRVLDTATGRVAAANDDAPEGTVSRLFCAGARERFVVSSEGRVDLIDAGTLETIASAAIPPGWHHVF